MSVSINIPVPPHKQRRLDTENNALLQLLVGSTPAQITAWMTTNVTTVAQTQRVLTALALAVRALYLAEQA